MSSSELISKGGEPLEASMALAVSILDIRDFLAGEVQLHEVAISYSSFSVSHIFAMCFVS